MCLMLKKFLEHDEDDDFKDTCMYVATGVYSVMFMLMHVLMLIIMSSDRCRFSKEQALYAEQF